MENKKRKKIIESAAIPLIFIISFAIIEYLKVQNQWALGHLGIYPRKWSGTIGIISAPFIHKNTEHLFSNMLPFGILSGMLIYFYRKVAIKSFFIMYFSTGLMVWFFAKEGYHIGASGVVYALAAFIVGTAIFRKNKRALSLCLIVVLYYGSLIWGLFPNLPNVSWESHLFGFIIGIAVSFRYRKDTEPEEEEGRIIYTWQMHPKEKKYFLPRDTFELTLYERYLEEQRKAEEAKLMYIRSLQEKQ